MKSFFSLDIYLFCCDCTSWSTEPGVSFHVKYALFVCMQNAQFFLNGALQWCQ